MLGKSGFSDKVSNRWQHFAKLVSAKFYEIFPHEKSFGFSLLVMLQCNQSKNSLKGNKIEGGTKKGMKVKGKIKG